MRIHRVDTKYAMNPFSAKHTKESMDMMDQIEKEEIMIKKKSCNTRLNPLLQ